MAAEHRFTAMGSQVHLIVVGGRASLIDTSRRRIDELERRWSRFQPDSEVSTLNARAGSPVAVSRETVELVERSMAAWRLSGGMFDPTLLGALLRAGYDRSFDELEPGAGPVPSPLQPGCSDIEVRGHEITLPAGSGFDPGGIGKGLAADIVTREAIAAGADGVCVNIGGDLRVAGASAAGEPWTIAVEHPSVPRPLVLVGITDGAVATSTTLRRRWAVARGVHHHLIDPFTGAPSTSDITLATCIAADGWVAEVMAKAVLLRGSGRAFDLVDGSGVEALAVRDDGRVLTTTGFTRFTGGRPPVEHVEVAA